MFNLGELNDVIKEERLFSIPIAEAEEITNYTKANTNYLKKLRFAKGGLK